MRLPEYCATHSLKEFMEMVDAFDGPDQEAIPMSAYITDPAHGGKVTCHKCNGFITEDQHKEHRDDPNTDEFPKHHFHKRCFNLYKHYYGLDRSID